MNTRKPVNLNKLGAIYGALWGVAAIVLMGALFGSWGSKPAGFLLSILGWAALGAPVGIVVTRLFGPRLRHAGWGKMTAMAPLTLLVGSFLFGCAHLTTYAIRSFIGHDNLGGTSLGNSSGLPILYVFYAFLMVWPVALAVLNCWHLRKMMSRPMDDTGIVWKV